MSASDEVHRHDDCDVKASSHHHTLGRQPNQAAPGNIGEILLAGVTLSGSKASYNATLMGQIVAALAALGATDNTT